MLRRVINVTNNFRYSKFIHVVVRGYNKLPHRSLANNSPYDIYLGRQRLNKTAKIWKSLRFPSVEK